LRKKLDRPRECKVRGGGKQKTRGKGCVEKTKEGMQQGGRLKKRTFKNLVQAGEGKNTVRSLLQIRKQSILFVETMIRHGGGRGGKKVASRGEKVCGSGEGGPKEKERWAGCLVMGSNQ